MDRLLAGIAGRNPLFIVFLFIYFAVPAHSVPARAGVIIDEIMQNPSAVSDSHGEWFEVFNTSATGVDLFHWSIADLGSNSHIISDHVAVPARGYLVLGRHATGNGGVTPGYVYGSDISLGNGADELLLFDAAGTERDRVEWDGGPDFPDPTGASMALLAPGLDNNAGASWTVSTAAFGAGDLGTPGAANFAAPASPDPAPVPVAAPDTLCLLLIPLAMLWQCRWARTGRYVSRLGSSGPLRGTGGRGKPVPSRRVIVRYPLSPSVSGLGLGAGAGMIGPCASRWEWNMTGTALPVGRPRAGSGPHRGASRRRSPGWPITR